MRTRAPTDDAAAREAMRMLLVGVPERLGLGLVAVALMAGLLAYAASGPWLWLWCAWLLLAHAYGYWLHRAFVRAAPAASELRQWARLYLGAAIFSGLGWGAAFLWFLPVPGPVETAMTVLFAAEVVGATTGSAGWFAASAASASARLVPMAIAFALLGDQPHLTLAVGALITLLLLLALSARLHRGILRVVRLLLDNRQLTTALELRTREAESANLAKSRFLAAASHDLGQPVHAVRMLLGVLRGQGLDAAQGETVDRLERSAVALSGLFDGLLDTAKLDANVVQAERETLVLQPLLRELLREYEPLALAKGLGLRLHCGDLYIVSDGTLLRRVLRNLLANAIRYSDRGGVLVAARRRAGAVAIEVWDTGIGIPEHARELVFEEFQQLANPQRDRLQGAGLGLAIVRRSLRLLGHRLELKSREGRGSLFRIFVPQAAQPLVPEAAATALSTLNAVVVAGDATVLEALSTLLHSWGCSVQAHVSLAALQRAFADMSSAPDVLLSDDHLPDGTGIDVVHAVRDEFNADIPALIVTGDRTVGNPTFAGIAHLALLHKPLSSAALFAALRELRRPPP